MTIGIFEQKLINLKNDLVEMGQDVFTMLKEAGEALVAMDKVKAKEVIKFDREVNDLENSVVHKAINLIATNQPVASDLRFLASSLRLAAELERIGDLGSNIARRTVEMAHMIEEGEPAEKLPENVSMMVQKAIFMLEMALGAFEKGDADSARKVIDFDDNIDDCNRTIRKQILKIVNDDGLKAKWGYEIITLASHIERLADHATNLAEETVYMAQGKTIRHITHPSNNKNKK
ncbi:MAG: phosphate signaling complex protein PhoU [Deltaproteobacteria bacterium]|jgi:phosphate transport system protein|nr:phosphate signaling complex protein PhoU [Deltaproteobacteria bacterium]